jgi:hypothetical protein
MRICSTDIYYVLVTFHSFSLALRIWMSITVAVSTVWNVSWCVYDVLASGWTITAFSLRTFNLQSKDVSCSYQC